MAPMRRWIWMSMMVVLAGIAPLAQAVDCIMHADMAGMHKPHDTMTVATCLDDVHAVTPDVQAPVAVKKNPAPSMTVAVLPEAWQRPVLPGLQRQVWPPGFVQPLAFDDVITRTGRRRI